MNELGVRLWVLFFLLILSGLLQAQTMLHEGAWKILGTGMLQWEMEQYDNPDQRSLEAGLVRFSNSFFGVGMQTRFVLMDRAESGTGSLTMMPHISIFAENAELWPLLFNLGRSYYYQFDRGRHSRYQRGWFFDMGFYLVFFDKFAFAPKYRFHSYPNTISSRRRFFLLEVAFFIDWR